MRALPGIRVEKLASMSTNKTARLALSVLVLVTSISAPLWAGQYGMTLLLLYFLYLALGQMWNLLAGFAGLVSLGQQLFIGLGGYTLVILSEYYHVPVWACIFLAGLTSAIVALVLSPAIFKMRGAFFSIATWVAAEAVGVFFSNWEYVRRGMGFFITAAYSIPPTAIYYLAVILGIGSVGIVFGLLRSRIGLALMAIRDNQDAAETMGINVFRYKLSCYLIASAFSGITGVAFYLFQVYIEPFAAFSINWTVAMVFIVIIGGIGHVEGPAIGAALYVVLRMFLSQYPGISLFVLGTIAILTILLFPSGIFGGIRRAANIEILSVKRG